jgi:DNA-directed RNA polymerase subunit RPC12/RpoP
MLNYRCKHCHTLYIIKTPKPGKWMILRCKQCGGELELENKQKTTIKYENPRKGNFWFYFCTDFTSENYLTVSF